MLHAPAYRAPRRIPAHRFPAHSVPERKADFDALSAPGWELVQAHLLKTLPPLKLAELQGNGNDTVEAVPYSVLEKYLKSRKGRELLLR